MSEPSPSGSTTVEDGPNIIVALDGLVGSVCDIARVKPVLDSRTEEEPYKLSAGHGHSGYGFTST